MMVISENSIIAYRSRLGTCHEDVIGIGQLVHRGKVNGHPPRRSNGTHVQSDSAGLQTNDHDFGIAGGSLEARYGLIAFLDVHRAVEPEPWKVFALQYGLDEIQE